MPLGNEEKDKLTRRAFLTGAALAAAGAVGIGGALALRGNRLFPKRVNESQASLYLIATAHIDTQWNWTVQYTIRNSIPRTMRPNWELFEKYPDYNFNFEGVIHYLFFKEYHPDQWPELQAWVRRGRWKLSGSWINAVDVIIPSAESLFRQALYGQQFFRREFGRVSRDIYLPDCFGFPHSLPTIARHSGLIAFSTQKLSWGCWVKAPFSVGRWKGVDGSEVVAALRCGSYGLKITSDVSRDAAWTNDFSLAGDRRVNLRYFGTGDTGGTPGIWTVARAQQSVEDKTAPVRALNTSADQLAKDLTPTERDGLPCYDGELVMSTVGVGGYTSQAARKKWNRMNEQMADAAERACLAAAWLGGPDYPQDLLTQSWIRVLWHQFHDDLPGTCIPQAYTFSWNDDLLSLNQFAQALTTGVGAVAQHLDTQTQGVPLVVYNALDQARTDVVEATITLSATASVMRVYDASTGVEVPSQILSRNGPSATVLFLATVPSVGFKVYDARPSDRPCALKTGLTAAADRLESDLYRVTLDRAGDIESVYDKTNETELLRASAQIQHFHDLPSDFPAWKILWETVNRPPRGIVNENPRIRIAENGPVRIALEVTRNLGDSVFVQQIRLTAGGDWVEVQNDVDWRTPGTLVKAAFPMTASNPSATFDIGLGTVERPNANEHRYEVNAQQWADITDVKGDHGLAILTNYKCGWDKPDDHTLRLSLIRTPDTGGNWLHQQTNDIGRHRFDYALAGHAGDWRKGNVPRQAARFNQPLRAFQTTRHDGLGARAFSLLQNSTEQVAVRALKKAEDSSEWVVRLQELHGETAERVAVSFAAPLLSAHEINAAEEPIGPYKPENGKLIVDLTAYQPRSFAVRLAASPARIAAPISLPITLPYDLDGVSLHADLTDGAFDNAGQTYPGELWPARLTADGIELRLGPCAPGAKNLLTCLGQTIALPGGDHNRLYLLAASVAGDRTGIFTVHARGEQAVETILTVQDWAEHIGQWDSRLAHPSHGDGGSQIVKTVKDGKVVGIEKMKPAYVKRAPVAWVGTHRHGIDGDQPYLFCYLFKYGLVLPPGAMSVTLPNNPSIRIMAMTAAQNLLDETFPAGVLFESQLTANSIPKPVVARLSRSGNVVFHLPQTMAFDGVHGRFTQSDVPDLPTQPDDCWTIDLSVFLDRQPEDGIMLGGFGDDFDASVLGHGGGSMGGIETTGMQRYLGKEQGGICFFAGGLTLFTTENYDVGKWQRVTATYDGVAVTLYKNGQAIGSMEMLLNETAPIVRLVAYTTSPIAKGFAGKIRDFTVMDAALTPDAVRRIKK